MHYENVPSAKVDFIESLLVFRFQQYFVFSLLIAKVANISDTIYFNSFILN